MRTNSFGSAILQLLLVALLLAVMTMPVQAQSGDWLFDLVKAANSGELGNLVGITQHGDAAAARAYADTIRYLAGGSGVSVHLNNGLTMAWADGFGQAGIPTATIPVIVKQPQPFVPGWGAYTGYALLSRLGTWTGAWMGAYIPTYSLNNWMYQTYPQYYSVQN